MNRRAKYIYVFGVLILVCMIFVVGVSVKVGLEANGIYLFKKDPLECDHSYGEWRIIDEPTCGEYGLKRHYCDKCGSGEDELIEPTGDHHFDESGVCTECGMREGELPTPPEDGNANLDDSGFIQGGGEESDPQSVVTVWSDISTSVYLRFKSFGDYNRKGWEEAKEFGSKIEDKYSMYYLPSKLISNEEKHFMRVSTKGSQYLLPYYTALGEFDYDIQSSDVKFAGKTDKEYSFSFYDYNYFVNPIPRIEEIENIRILFLEMSYRRFVNSNYLSVPESTAQYLQTIIDAQGWKNTDANIIQKVARYISSSAQYDLNYDQQLNQEDDIVIAFLRDYKTGICQHYASAATLMYRTLGIPARYTVGFVGETVANEYSEITSDQAHAWVEVYMEGFGWVNVEVTGSGFGSGLPSDSQNGSQGEPSEGEPGDSQGGSGEREPSEGEPGGLVDTSGKIQGTLDSENIRTMVKVWSDTSTTVYLRNTSFGDYNLKGWEKAKEYSSLIKDNGNSYSLMYMPGIALESRQPSKIKIASEGGYLLPYYPDPGMEYDYDVQSSDVTYSGNTSKEYSLNFFDYNYFAGEEHSIKSEYENQEKLYAYFVRGYYLSVPESTAQYLKTIVDEQGWHTNEDDIVQKVARYIRSSAQYDLNYDQQLNQEDDIVVSFLRDYKTGICQHYASAATLMYRMLGIPARYTVGFVGETKAGEYSEITSAQAHAWVEVYMEGFGWVNVEVTGSTGDGTIPGGEGQGDEGNGNETSKTDLNITTPSDSKTYDGEPLVSKDLKDFDVDGLLEGHHLDLSDATLGSQTDVGSSKNTVEGLKIVDENGNDVTDQYNLNFKYGDLNVEKRSLNVTTPTENKEYDGEPLITDKEHGYDEDNFNPEGLLEGHHLDLSGTTFGSQTELGSSDNTVEGLKIVDGDGNDVTGNYDIQIENGKLTVEKRKLTVTSPSISKDYDGESLTPSENDFEAEGLLDGHYLDFSGATMHGSQTDVGSTESSVEGLKVRDRDGNDVTEYYDLNVEKGELNVNKRKLIIETNSATKIYDGEPLSAEHCQVLSGLLSGHRLDAHKASYPSITKVGTEENIVTGLRIKSTNYASLWGGSWNEKDVTDYYEIEYQNGTLTIDPRPITVTTNSHTKVYDGTPLSDESYQEISNLLKGNSFNVDDATYTSITNVGTIDNVISNYKILDTSGNDVTGQYSITFIYGKLEVTVREITITTGSKEFKIGYNELLNSHSKAYTEHSYTLSDSLTSSDSLPNGLRVEIEFTASISQPGSCENTATVKIVDNAGKDVSSNFHIKVICGTLTLTVSA